MGVWLMFAALSCAGSAGAQAGTETFVWQDGATAREVWLRPDLVAEFTTTDEGGSQSRSLAAFTEEVHRGGGAIIHRATSTSADENGPRAARAPSPFGTSEVFQDQERGGRLRALPGNVVVTLDPNWSSDRVDEWVRVNGQRLVQRIDISGNVLVLESPPGMASLDLATRLNEQSEVVAAQPNWWVEVGRR
jgi:hypothetical protein